MIGKNQFNSVYRLHLYRKALQRLKQMGFVRVFSDNMADAAGVTPTQVRRDFASFGLTGQKRGGYSVQDLLANLDVTLGKERPQNAVVLGVGNIGHALLNYRGFTTAGIRVVAGFDSDPRKIDAKAAVPVLPLEKLRDFVNKNETRVAILAVPEDQAQAVFDLMIRAGIQGVLNFAPLRLTSPNDDVVVHNIDVGLEIEKILYLVNQMNKE
ncbi:MAG: redox-sensing transcriptional repressor Rex [Elusimicrobia bacterium]|nr:MAG: redox-sensing transcriptional repressor Rex [Elusimicrobiota bacterium]